MRPPSTSTSPLPANATSASGRCPGTADALARAPGAAGSPVDPPLAGDRHVGFRPLPRNVARLRRVAGRGRSPERRQLQLPPGLRVGSPGGDSSREEEERDDQPTPPASRNVVLNRRERTSHGAVGGFRGAGGGRGALGGWGGG